MSDLFRSSKAVLRRANKHIADLEASTEAFRCERSRKAVVEYDPAFGKHILKVKFDVEAFEEMSCIMFDAVSNLRACLDQMTDEVATKHRGQSRNRAYFPIRDEATVWAERISKLEGDLPPEVLMLFGWFQPYKGGNDTLWALNHLANVNKHAKLIPVGTGVGAMLSFPNGRPPLGEFVTIPPELHLSDEIPILAVAPGTDAPPIDVRCFIAIDHDEVIVKRRQPASLLHTMSGYVSSILHDTEAVCREIGMT